MTLLEKTIAYLDHRGILSALIGGAALAVHGIARATLDVDLLANDHAVLEPAFWDDWGGPERPEIRRGDAEDPLAGVVRLCQGEETVDVVVGKHAWEAEMLSRRMQVTVGGQSLSVVDRADLIVLKLFAGGPQDLLDIQLLLAADTGDLRSEVDRRVTALPQPIREAWARVQAS